MHKPFAEQLAGLDLSGFSFGPAPVNQTDFPVRDAVVQTLDAVWSELFALVVGTALEADAEDLGWAFVNLFHRAAERKESALDRATDQVRSLIAMADGSEVHAHDLETEVERAQCAESAMIAYEEMREVAAGLYLNEFGSSWKPASSSRLNHAAMLTSALVEGRQFLRARTEAKRRAAMPEGTPVIFAGGRSRHASEDDALALGNAIWDTLDKVRARVPDMVLVHGGDTKGADRIAGSWAERHKVAQVTFSLDVRLGARAGFARNERMLSINPRYVVAFPGNGVLERLVIEAKARRITVVDRRGPLGTNPKAAD
ncbi:DUF2493 domain-containing protein [Novosphingobium percolationis]|uniref:DUF2493 domain-containing protein n=1 Tax=Novosphingobium percolationis TaxID=2871811 RepID=UPI001CD1F417|nr:DUF2493 domain-containing protein [Novosphingobium percolationis]